VRKEKCLWWRLLCSEFSHKTPTAKIWRFIRSYKNKSLRAHLSSPDYNSLVESQDLLLQKLCPPSCLHKFFSPLRPLKALDSSDSPFSWMDNPFSLRELEAAIDFSKKKSFLGLDRIDYAILRALLLDFRKIFLDILT